jgi:phosphohistidine phosphatase SixA
MRHGPAEAGGGEDPDLSPPGTRVILEAARGMRALGLSFASIHSSPLRRAMQTAAIVAEAFGRPGGWSVLPEAAPGACLTRVAARLGAMDSAGPVLVVGHQPDMGRMAMDAIGARQPLPFAQGTLCGVELGDWSDPEAGRPGRLCLFAPADLLARINEQP